MSRAYVLIPIAARATVLVAVGIIGLTIGATWVSPVAADDDSASATSPWRFQDRAATGAIDWVQRSGTAQQGFICEVKSTGVALLDYDGDGLLDLFFTAGSTIERQRAGQPGFGCRLYRNLGGFRFEDVTAAAGIPELGWASGAAAADVDGDGRTDLLVTCIGADHLLHNTGGRFQDLGASAGLGVTGWSTSAAFADLDGDGDLDLYVCGYLDFDFEHPPRHGEGRRCVWRGTPVACGPRGLTPLADHVYRNRGDGRFEDVSSAWGITRLAPSYGLAVVVSDLVGDARPEIYVANDSGANFLLTHRPSDGPTTTRSKTDTPFTDIGLMSGAGFDSDGHAQAGMGIEVADLDDDGQFDLLVTNFEQERNNAYLNHGRRAFHDKADVLGLGAPSYGSLAWGIGCHDFDRDGRLDIFVANGHVYPQAADRPGQAGYAQRDHLLVGVREGDRTRFQERGLQLGLGAARVSRGAAFGDLDNDGDVDIVVAHLNAPPAVWENQSPSDHHGLTITLRQPGQNREAIGARVTVTAGSLKRVLEVRRQHSFQSSSDPRLFVGLGKSPVAGQADVRWPDGTRERFALPAGGTVTLKRGQGSTP